ncbi:Ig-like domain-containing protein [Thiomicrorhabdus xiamenensis]|uniref:Ig-like domain-containing protein n=1 Tax=Thiomicrorhabdus xiamenensis TaxID=2739063 RepID=A0A7D4TDH1_9GAMM|nr:Ig-like domain-containing protein [Thiomicrorhabdus xiamenensis]QKI88627.1 Ig-like domain-containing protein [Thiomicrorhabdus xiamenensis]
MKMSVSGLLLAFWIALLTGCGGPGSSDNFESPVVGLNAKMTVDSVETTDIPAGGTADVYLLLLDEEGFPISNVAVVLEASSGTLSDSSVVTGSNGEAMVTLSAPATGEAGSLTASAATGDSASISYVVIDNGSSGGTTITNSAGINLTLTVASTGEESFSSTEDFRVNILLLDSNGDPVPQSIVNVSATSGSLVQNQLLTDANGEASIDINAPESLTVGTAPGTFTASSETGYSAKVNYEFVATGTVGEGEVPPAASIQFIAPSTPIIMSLKGTGGYGYGETAQVSFKVVDDAGNPVQGATIEFGLTTEVGGLSLSALEAVSNAAGEVSTTVQAGTIATPVRVTATMTLDSGEVVFVQSDLLTVTTGIPDQNSMSLSLETFAPESLGIDGVTVPVTIRLADRNNNPVPDGTVVNFTTEGGRIGDAGSDGSCVTSDSECSVTWTSQNPRPADHRVQIIAYAIGHESYYDRNADGIFNDGDVFDDMKEAYRDDDESGHFDATATEAFVNDFARDERFIDYNSNQVFDHEDGAFNGVPCEHTTDCVVDPQTTLTNVRAQATLIMADSFATPHLLSTTAGSCLDGNGKLKTDGSCSSNITFGTGADFAVLWVMAEDSAALCHDGTGNGMQDPVTPLPYVRVDAIDPDDVACTAAIRQSPATGSSIEVTSDIGDLSEIPVDTVDNQLGAVEFFMVLASSPDNATTEVGTVELVVTSPSGKKSTTYITVTDPAN